ncbi:MAG: glycerol-3-phosphate acyltransferase [Chloroflexota bacterium]
MEESTYFVILAALAFCLGACPFSVWVGRWFLDKDIRDYGDGNPGAANVFRAGGGRRYGLLAVALDVAKGVPFVLLAHRVFGLPETAVLAVGFSAVLGHAFSPVLKLKGGKAIAVSYGVLLALPHHTPLVSFTGFMVLGALAFGDNAWGVMLGPVGSLAYLTVTEGATWYTLFMLCLLALLAAKHLGDLKSTPRLRPAVRGWLRGSSKG